jgi:L-lactate dehydrogenase complex protein LldF
VKINIPRHLVNLRRDIVNRKLDGWMERLVYRWWARGLRNPFLYRLIGGLQKFDLRRRAGGSGWVARLPRIAGGWTAVRDLPAPAPRSFHQLWKDRP